MKHQFSLIVASLSLAVLSACSSTPAGPVAGAPAVAKGDALVSTTGQALYTYKKDVKPDVSACVRECLKVFGPLYSLPDDKAVGSFKIIERNDGSNQWSYKGKPLYLCSGSVPVKGANDKMIAAAKKKAEACAKAMADFEVAKP